jgi:hypothetical protein
LYKKRIHLQMRSLWTASQISTRRRFGKQRSESLLSFSWVKFEIEKRISEDVCWIWCVYSC